MDWIKIQLSSEEKIEIKNSIKQIENKTLLKRLQCLQLKDKKWKHEEVADFLDVSINSITNWIKAYRSGGLTELLQWNHKGRISILSLADQAKIKARNTEKPFDTAKEAKDFIEKEFGIKWHLHWVQKLLKKNFDFHTSKPDSYREIAKM